MRFEAVIARFEEANMLLSIPGEDGFTHIVSIGEVGSRQPFRVRISSLPKLRLEFSDIRFVTKEAEAESNAHGYYIQPNEHDITRLIRFLDFIKQGRVLFHCAAGVSRSAAAALIYYAMKLGPGHEREAVVLTRQTKHNIDPNPTMVAIADRLLGRQGKLVAETSKEWQWPPQLWVSSELHR